MARRLSRVACLFVLALAVGIACSGGGYGGGGNNTGGNPYNPNVPDGPSNPDNPNNPGQPTTPGVNEVFARNTTFDPTVRTVAAGTTVTWRNVSVDVHTITPDGHTQFARQELNSTGATFSMRFDVPGTYLYHCEIHGSPGAGMNGRIVVQ